jgi:diadenosine tetraphosphate (Ap4A) HIT family hydrolase
LQYRWRFWRSEHRNRAENDHAVTLSDVFPVAEGHTLVVPRKHVGSIYKLSVADQNALWERVNSVREQLLCRLKP